MTNNQSFRHPACSFSSLYLPGLSYLSAANNQQFQSLHFLSYMPKAVQYTQVGDSNSEAIWRTHSQGACSQILASTGHKICSSQTGPSNCTCLCRLTPLYIPYIYLWVETDNSSITLPHCNIFMPQWSYHYLIGLWQISCSTTLMHKNYSIRKVGTYHPHQE